MKELNILYCSLKVLLVLALVYLFLSFFISSLLSSSSFDILVKIFGHLGRKWFNEPHSKHLCELDFPFFLDITLCKALVKQVERMAKGSSSSCSNYSLISEDKNNEE